MKDIKPSGYWGGYGVRSEAGDNRTNSSENLQKNKAETVPGLVSIIMPVYNTPDELISAAVKSVVSQTYEQLELLIIDDGSKNECAETCDRLAEDNRVRVIHTVNAGASAARNVGLDNASGEYIAFIDSDDTMDKAVVQTMIDQIQNADFITIGCRHVKEISWEKNGEFNNSFIASQKQCIEYLCYMNAPYSHIETNSIWGKIYRRRVIGDLRFDDQMVIAEDFKFNFDYIMRSSTGIYADYVGYNYYEHQDSISRRYKPEMMITIEKMKQMIKEYESTVVFDALLSRCVNIAFTILMMVPLQLKTEKREIEGFISTYRKAVWQNKNTKKKVKLAILTSYIGYEVTIGINKCL